MLRVIRVDSSPQILQPPPGGLIGHVALTWLNTGLPVVLIRRAGGPVYEVAAELGLELDDRLVAEKAIEIEESDQQKVVLRPRSLVFLVLGAFGYLVGCEDVSYCEDASVCCADCGCVPSADVGFERLRSAVNVVAAATCADLPATVEDDPGFIVLSKPESWWLSFAARHDGFTSFRMARGVVKSLPATLAISRIPAAAALRNDDNVNGPCGKNTAAASTRVITSSSPHWAGSGRAFARTILSVLRMSWTRYS